MAARPAGAAGCRRSHLPARCHYLQHRPPHPVPLVSRHAYGRRYRPGRRKGGLRREAGTHLRQDELLQAALEAQGGCAPPQRRPHPRARRRAAEARPQAVDRNANALGAGEGRGSLWHGRPHMASAFHQCDPRPGVRAAPPGAGRPSANRGRALAGVPARRHRPGGASPGPHRPSAPRPC